MYSYNVSFEITILNVRFFFCSCFFWCWILLLMCNACDFTKYHLQPLLVKFLVDFTNFSSCNCNFWLILPNLVFSSCWCDFMVDFTEFFLQQLLVISGWFYQMSSSAAGGVISSWFYQMSSSAAAGVANISAGLSIFFLSRL